MGLFWGKKKKEEPAAVEKEMDPRERPLMIGSIMRGTVCAGSLSGQLFGDSDFTFIIRDIQKGVHDNNDMICAMYDMMEHLIEENKRIQNRLDQLENKQSLRKDPPVQRAI